MCGRFTNGSAPDEIGAYFGVDQVGEGLPEPNWNISPTDSVYIVIESAEDPEPPTRRLEAARWALIRPGARDLKSGPPMFNSRSETVTEKFGWAMNRRALIAVESYFEWHTEGKVKTPFNIHPSEPGQLLAAAAITSWWRNPAVADGDPARWVLSTSMLTMDAVPGLAGIHDRNPVFLPEAFWADWLDPEETGDKGLVSAAVAAAIPVAEQLVFHQVRPIPHRGNGPELVEAVSPGASLPRI